MSKKRQTLKATPKGLEQAEKALKRLHGTKLSFANYLAGVVGRSSIQKFFQGQEIKVDKFKEICKALTLESDWEVIAGLTNFPDQFDFPDNQPPKNGNLQRNDGSV